MEKGYDGVGRLLRSGARGEGGSVVQSEVEVAIERERRLAVNGASVMLGVGLQLEKLLKRKSIDRKEIEGKLVALILPAASRGDASRIVGSSVVGSRSARTTP